MALHVEQTNKTDIKSVPDDMDAWLYYGPQDIRFEKVKTPKITESGILLKIQVALTGGSSYKTIHRGHPVLINKNLPSPLGHQFSGVVAKVGKDVKGFAIGDKVAAVNSAPCFKCSFCFKEEFNLCEDLLFLNGAYAEYIALPERITLHNSYKIPENTSFEAAAYLESLAVVLHGLDKSKVTKGKTVCIIGTGGIGLIFALLSKHFGANVISIGRKESKLKIAKELGADHVFKLENKAELIQQVKNLTSGGPDIVIEAVGLPETWELATEIVSKGGLVNFFGGCKKETKVSLDTYKLHYEELKLIGTFHHTPVYVQTALGLLKRSPDIQKKLLDNLITHKFNLSDLEKAFPLYKEGKAITCAVFP